ncbi:hypothetical protein GOV04_02145 [Candidatus Woesearchaeota archaeon]|nr:hypothetical protein [Candidatus Woesearchaeota archaeon]
MNASAVVLVYPTDVNVQAKAHDFESAGLRTVAVGNHAVVMRDGKQQRVSDVITKQVAEDYAAKEVLVIIANTHPYIPSKVDWDRRRR